MTKDRSESSLADSVTSSAGSKVSRRYSILQLLQIPLFDGFANFHSSAVAFTVDYNSTFHSVWLSIISIAFVYNAIVIPLRASFIELNFDYTQTWVFLDYAFADAVYLCDMLVRARTKFFQQGIRIEDKRELFIHYSQSGYFAFDIISIFPTDFIYLAVGNVYTLVRLNRLLRYKRLFEMLSKFEKISPFPNVFRIGSAMLGFVSAVFYVALFYNSYSKAIGYGNSDSDFPLPKRYAELPVLTRFTKCLFWATMEFCLFGLTTFSSDSQERFVEVDKNGALFANASQTRKWELLSMTKTLFTHFYKVVIWIIGIMAYTVLFGRLIAISKNASSVHDTYYSQLKAVKEYLNYQKIPDSAIDKVTTWFQYAFERNMLANADTAIEELTDKLKGELSRDMHLATLEKVQLFRGLQRSLLTELLVRLKLKLYSPGEFVCRKGDIGREMYIVKQGVLEVVSDDGKEVLVTLSAGSVFGEISLLNIPGSKAGNRRTANVRSKGYSDLFSLSKDDLYTVLREYPSAMLKLIEKGTRILRSENNLDEDLIKNQTKQKLTLKQRIEALKIAIEETEKTITLLIASIQHSHSSASKRLDAIENILLSPAYRKQDFQSQPEMKKKKVTFATLPPSHSSRSRQKPGAGASAIRKKQHPKHQHVQ